MNFHKNRYKNKVKEMSQNNKKKIQTKGQLYLAQQKLLICRLTSVVLILGSVSVTPHEKLIRFVSLSQSIIVSR